MRDYWYKLSGCMEVYEKASRSISITLSLGLLCVAGALFSGCSAPAAIAGGVLGATVIGANSPAHEISQVYYIGIFDRAEQVPSTIYRLTVRGQSSFISSKKFASGWVPAKLIDSLNSRIEIDPNATTEDPLKINKGEKGTLAQIKGGRKMVLFGPEGFREAPEDFRLVIVMGSSPQAFFQAIDSALGSISQVRLEKSNSQVQRLLFEEYTRVKQQEEIILELRKDVAVEMAN